MILWGGVAVWAVSGSAVGAIVSVVTSLAALGGVIYTQRSAARTKREETAVAAWEALLQPIRDRLAEVEAELRRQRIWRREAVSLLRRAIATHPNFPDIPEGFEIEE